MLMVPLMVLALFNQAFAVGIRIQLTNSVLLLMLSYSGQVEIVSP